MKVLMKNNSIVDLEEHIKYLRHAYSALCIAEKYTPTRVRLLKYLIQNSDAELHPLIYLYFTGNSLLTTMTKACQMEKTALVGTLRSDAIVIMDVQEELAKNANH